VKKLCQQTSPDEARRLVGDPIDVVTGANLDQTTDFRLPGAPAFEWWRYYDSRRCAEDQGLGRGFSHDLDRRLEFDLDGISYTDPRGRSTHFPFLVRDGEQAGREGWLLERVNKRRYRLRRSDERAMEFQVKDSGLSARLVEWVDGDRRLRLQYENLGWLSAVTLGADRVLLFDYEGEHLAQVLLEQRSKGRKVSLIRYRYDEQGRLVEGEDAYRHLFRYTYDAAHRVVKKTDRRGYAFLFQYDSRGRCVSSAGEDGVQAVRLEYRPAQRVTLVTRADGGGWQYMYDANGTVTQIIDPYGGIQVFKLDAQGRVCEEIDPLGNVIRVLYDPAGAPMGRVDPQGYALPLFDDPTAPLPRSHRVGQCVLEWEYGDRVPLPSAEASPERMLAMLPVLKPYLAPPTPAPVMTRDLQGLRLREEGTDGKARRWAFDPNGNPRWYKDFDGSPTRYEYASWNHLVREEDALGYGVTYEYTASEKLSALTDGGGTRSEYAYDLKDRLVEVRRHGRVRERYGYDLAGNLLEKRDAQGNLLLSFTMAPGNLKATRTLASGDEHRFVHDDRGRVLVAEGKAGKCTFAYDARDRRTEDRRDGLGTVHWYEADRLVQTVVLGRYSTRYTRADSTTTWVTDPGGQVHCLQRMGDGLVLRRFSSGASELGQYDARGRCVAKLAYLHEDAQKLWKRRYHFSAEGDLLSVEDSVHGKMSCTYDAVHRLAQVTLPGGGTERFEYDAAHNLLRQPGLEARVQSGNQLSQANGDTFRYDARDAIGAREGPGGTVRYERDSRDQLVRIHSPGLRWEAEYDPLGRRTCKRVNGAQWTYYWDTDRLAAEVSPEGRLRVFVYAAGVALVPLLFIDYDSIEAPPESGRRFFVFCDWRGAPERVVDEQGEVVWQARLEPYGRAHVEVGEDFHQPLRFPGHYFDAETGLHYNRFRYYSPELGRYLESDPSGIEGGFNLYAYTRDPLTQVDVRGLSENCPPGGEEPPPQRRQSEDGADAEGTNTRRQQADAEQPYRPLSDAEIAHILTGDFRKGDGRTPGRFDGGGHGAPNVAELRSRGYQEITPEQFRQRRAAEQPYHDAMAAYRQQHQAWVQGGRQGRPPREPRPQQHLPEGTRLMSDERVFYRNSNRDGASEVGGIIPNGNRIHTDGHTRLPSNWGESQVRTAAQHLETSPGVTRTDSGSMTTHSDYVRFNQHGGMEVAPPHMADPPANGYTQVTLLRTNDTGQRTLFPNMNQTPRSP